MEILNNTKEVQVFASGISLILSLQSNTSKSESVQNLVGN